MRVRFLIVTVLAFFLGCIPAPASAPDKSRRDLAADVREKSVALVRLAYQISLTPDAIKLDPVTKPFCTAVWVSGTMLMTAQHCVDEMVVGEELAYVTSRELDPESKLQKVRIAKLVRTDADHDLALLEGLSPPFNHGVAKLSEQTIEPGDETHTMGHPLGLWFSFSSGEVSAVRKSLLSAGDDDPIKETLWVQTYADISPGNSGGGLFDQHGDLMGICSRSRRDGNGLHFYVHRDHLKAFLGRQA